MAYKDTNIKSGVLKKDGGYVEHGFGQVEPNHLSAQRTGQIYAQLPSGSVYEDGEATGPINILENGQFVKYDYERGEVNFVGAGEWMLVFNEIKTYHDGESAADFAMIRGNYLHHVYSPYDGEPIGTYQSRFYGPNGVYWSEDTDSVTTGNQPGYVNTKGDGTEGNTRLSDGYITAPARDDVKGSTINPFANLQKAYSAKKMADPRAMVPRVLKTNIGDIFTTNTINATEASLNVGNVLYVGDDGYLTTNKGTNSGTMEWQVVKKYTMPDGQQGVKIMRIA